MAVASFVLQLLLICALKLNAYQCGQIIPTVYSLDLVSSGVTFNDPKYLETFTYVSKYNRTVKVVNLNQTAHVDLSPHSMVRLTLFEFKSNEFRQFPLDMKIPICEFLAIWLHLLVPQTPNYPYSCPFLKGSYYLINVIPSANKFPPGLRKGLYRLAMKVYRGTTIYSEYFFEGRLDRGA